MPDADKVAWLLGGGAGGGLAMKIIFDWLKNRGANHHLEKMNTKLDKLLNAQVRTNTLLEGLCDDMRDFIRGGGS